jgi:hypothetical protein
MRTVSHCSSPSYFLVSVSVERKYGPEVCVCMGTFACNPATTA